MAQEQENAPLDPEQFVRVWKRVMPEDRECPVEIAPLPDKDAVSSGQTDPEQTAFLRWCILQELCQWKRWFGLSSALAQQSYSRAKRLTAALFLLSGQWYFPAQKANPKRCGSWRDRLRTLFQNSKQLEASYCQTARTATDPMLRELFSTLAEEQRTQQKKIRHILENR